MIDNISTSGQQNQSISMTFPKRVSRDIVGYGTLCPDGRDASSFRIDEVQEKANVVNGPHRSMDPFDKGFLKTQLKRQSGANYYLPKSESAPSLSMLLFASAEKKDFPADALSRSKPLSRTPGIGRTYEIHVKQDVDEFVKPALMRRSGAMVNIKASLTFANNSDDGNNDNGEDYQFYNKHMSLNDLLSDAVQISESTQVGEINFEGA
jgi:hypothetical protein